MNICAEHKKSFEYICNKCALLFCSRCAMSHNKNHQHNQYCHHIDDIRQSLTDINENNDREQNNDNNNNENKDAEQYDIAKTIETIWSSLKSDTTTFNKLASNEKDIEQRFHELHEYLREQQHKLLKPIIESKDSIIDIINNNIDKLKHLVTIVNINNNNMENSDNNKQESTSEVEDSTDLYSLETIMKSINESESLNSFIINNNKTLFNEYNKENLGVSPNDDNDNDNDKDSIILHLIMKYYNNNQNNNNNNQNSNNNNNLFRISTNPFDYKQFDSLIGSSIKIESSITINDSKKTNYILSLHLHQGATLINTSDNSIEQLDNIFNYRYAQFSFANYANVSMISIGEHIYMFDKLNLKIFSIKSKSIIFTKEYETFCNIVKPSVCYDGQDYIYLLNDYDGNQNIIHRFNIKTNVLEIYHRFPKEYVDHSAIHFGLQLSSMIYNGVLYSISNCQIYTEFDLNNKTISGHELEIQISSVCHDNNGNFYIHSSGGDNAEFIRFNVITQQTTNLNPIPVKDGNDKFFMLYEFVSPNESYIYSIGGATKGNFKYSIESDQSQPYFRNDVYTREGCESISTSI